jgi:hypothetical protein
MIYYFGISVADRLTKERELPVDQLSQANKRGSAMRMQGL